ncbi:MAG: hypothetical protein P4L40_13820, partial [Terracidiphilus sp.]|nr:hypothetical protein [Terracidiphilus sp.]
FARATEKLSLEQAVLGGDASAMINTNKPRDANDIERMLRLGAASVMGQSLESGGGAAGGEDDAVAKAFMQSSIEDLLATHSRTIEIGETGVGFGSSEAEPVPTLDLNAEDFWEQVLPGFQSADKLLARLNDPDGPIQALKKATSKRDPERQERIEQRDEFVEDVAALVEFLCGKEGDVDRDSMLVMAKADVAAASKLLTLMTTLSSVFTSAQVALAEEWLAKLEGSRVRTCRAERVVGWAEVDEAASESDDSAGSDSVSEGDIFGAEAPPGAPEPDIVSDDEFDIMAEAVGDSDGSGDKKKGKGKAQKSMGEVWKSRKMNLGGPNAGMNDVCALCEDGGLLLVCDGLCNRAFHLPCVGLKAMPSSPEWLCPDCTAKAHLCLICGEVGSDVESKKEQALWLENDAKLVRKCCMKKCGRFYHHRWVCV